MIICVGIDIHKRVHQVAILDEFGKPVGKSFKIKNTRHGFDELMARVCEANPHQLPVRFGMEATGHYWLSLHAALVEREYEVIVFNPLRTIAYRNLQIRPVKNDRIDARCIAEIVRMDPEPDHYATDESLASLRQLTRMRTELCDQIADQKRRITSLLDQIFPELLPLFPARFNKGALAVMEHCPTPAEVLELGLEKLTELLDTATRGRMGQKRAEEIYKAAETSFGMQRASTTVSFQIKLFVKQVHFIQEQVSEIEDEIEQLISRMPQHLTSITGIGSTLAATILGEIGHIERFRNGKALVAYAGIDPRVVQSGQFNGTQMHISKRGSSHLRRAVWMAAMAASRSDPALKALLQRKIAEGKHYYVAIGAVANKLLHIIYAVLRDNQPYRPMLPIPPASGELPPEPVEPVDDSVPFYLTQ